MSSGTVELETEIIECSFNEKHIYQVSVLLKTPTPSNAPNDPGFENPDNYTSNQPSSTSLLKTEQVGPSHEPRFGNNKFVFKVPSISSNNTILSHETSLNLSSPSSTNEFLMFTLLFHVFLIENVDNNEMKKETLIGIGELKSNNEISQKLLGKKTISQIVYVHKEKSEQLLGSIDIELSLNLIKTEKDKVVVKRKNDNELKLTNLVAELRKSSEVHLQVLSEANKFTNKNFGRYIRNISEDLETKRKLIEKLLSEMNSKNEIIDTYKKTLKKERKKYDIIESKMRERENEVVVMKENKRLYENKDEAYKEIEKVRKRNIILLKRQKHMKELERAHKEQSKVLIKTQKKLNQFRKFKSIAAKQEVIIKKLEKVLSNEFKKRKKIKQQTNLIVEDDSSLLKQRIIDLEEDLKMKNEKIITYKEENDVLRDKIYAINEELKLTTKTSAKEISFLRIKLAQAGINLSSMPLINNTNKTQQTHYIGNPPQRIHSNRNNNRIITTQSRRSIGGKSILTIPTLPKDVDDVSELGSEFDDISLPPLSVKRGTISEVNSVRKYNPKEFKIGEEIGYDAK